VFIPVSDWFPAFMLTLAIEVPVGAVLLRRTEPDLVRLVALIAAINLATHLAVWYVFSQLFLPGTLGYTVAAEAWAIGCEAVFYRLVLSGLTAPRALTIAAVANLASFAAGRLIGGTWLDRFG
jgi:hypothetical protein